MQTYFDLENLYKTYFLKTPYHVPGSENEDAQNLGNTGVLGNKHRGRVFSNNKQIAFNKVRPDGRDIWFPVKFIINNNIEETLEIDACTIAVNLSKTIVRTAVSERKGTVKEMFNIDDYKFTIKGFLIGKNREVPEDDIDRIKKIFETDLPVTLNGGYPELFLVESTRVAVTSLEFPEVQGKAHWIRPFNLTCESDFIADVKNLEVPNNVNTN